MNVEQFLKVAGVPPIIVSPDTTVAETARLLASKNKGVALVCDPDRRLLGVVSVMDISRAVAQFAERAPAMAASAIMTENFCACAPGDSVDDALAKMKERRIRHLPVVEDGVLRGLLNLRGVLEQRSREAEIEANEVRGYIFGAGYH